MQCGEKLPITTRSAYCPNLTPRGADWSASFRELGLQPPIPSVETGDLAILRQLHNSSDMLTAISPPQFMFEIQAELPVSLGVTTRQIGLTLRDGAMLFPAALAVLDTIYGVVRELPN